MKTKRKRCVGDEEKMTMTYLLVLDGTLYKVLTSITAIITKIIQTDLRVICTSIVLSKHG